MLSLVYCPRHVCCLNDRHGAPNFELIAEQHLYIACRISSQRCIFWAQLRPCGRTFQLLWPKEIAMSACAEPPLSVQGCQEETVYKDSVVDVQHDVSLHHLCLQRRVLSQNTFLHALYLLYEVFIDVKSCRKVSCTYH